MVVANLVSQDGIGFDSDENEVRAGDCAPANRFRWSALPNARSRARIFDEMIKLRLALHASK